MPSMAKTELLGLKWISAVGFPSRSTYWVATWPFSASFRARSSEARNRPSPWEMGTVYTWPGWVFMSQGDLLDATRVWTRRDWWRPMVLKVRVGLFSSVSMISP